MTTCEISSSYPNVLLISGSDAYAGGNVDFGLITRFLESHPSGCPGSVLDQDFWIFHPRPNSAGGVHVGTETPPRGLVRMHPLPDTLDAASASLWLNTLAQEMGHAWLVPSGLGFGTQPLVGAFPWIEEAFRGEPLRRLALLGRGDVHWSSFLKAGVSPMDGVNWVESPAGSQYPYVRQGYRGEMVTLRRYVVSSGGQTNVSVPGIPGDVPASVYSDLDLTIMGVLDPSQAYEGMQSDPGVEPGIDDLIPQWIGPCSYHAGLALVFGTDDVVVFGFFQDCTTLGVQRTGQGVRTVDIADHYGPWQEPSRIYLRIVRHGDTYYFQARPDVPAPTVAEEILIATGRRPASPPIDPFADLPSTSEQLSSWTTVAAITESTVTPQAVGYLVKTWTAYMPWVDVSFRPLQVRDAAGNENKVGRVRNPSSPVTRSDYLSGIAADTLTYHRPKAGPNLRFAPDLMNLYVAASVPNSAPGVTVTPGADHAEVGAHDLWVGTDDAPKLVIAAPPGDSFVVAGSVRIDRCMVAPWAAGLLVPMHMVAYPYHHPMSTFGIPGSVRENQVRPGDSFKAAHILVAAQRSDITDTMIGNVDTLRRVSEGYFSTITRRLTLTTEL